MPFRINDEGKREYYREDDWYDLVPDSSDYDEDDYYDEDEEY